MYLPDNELMSAVLKEKVDLYKKGDILNYKMVVYDSYGYYAGRYSINMYELVHLMKLWAFDKGFEIVERYCDTSILNMESEEVHLVEMYGEDIFSPSRVFKCCEWILSEQSKK